MDSPIFLFVIGGLFVVIIAEFLFLVYVLDCTQKEKARLLEELAKANTAIVAKDANSYVMMRSMDNVVREEPKPNPEGVDASELTDEEYDKMIAQANK